MNRHNWPGGPPWMRGHRMADRYGRARFFRRMRFGALMLFFLALSGLVTGGWQVTHWLPREATPLAILFIIFGAMALSVMFGAARRAASPLGEVMEAADRVADGDYDVRVNESGPPPIRALARSFNTMTGRLANADRLRRDLMADVAHELRTPLSVLQGRLEGLIDGVYPRDQSQLAQLLEETHVLSRLVDDLRTLALSQAGALPLAKEPTDIVALTRDAIRSLHGSGAPIEGPTLPSRTIDLDPVRVREVLTNLLSNAIRHTPADGRIAVVLEDEGDRIAVSVTDNGEGIAPENLSKLFDRFYKGAGSRGSGLGLAIAKGIVSAHGGEITASSTPGQGTTVRFTLPIGSTTTP